MVNVAMPEGNAVELQIQGWESYVEEVDKLDFC